MRAGLMRTCLMSLADEGRPDEGSPDEGRHGCCPYRYRMQALVVSQVRERCGGAV